jgi:hypothetical protein
MRAGACAGSRSRREHLDVPELLGRPRVDLLGRAPVLAVKLPDARGEHRTEDLTCKPPSPLALGLGLAGAVVVLARRGRAMLAVEDRPGGAGTPGCSTARE